MRTIKEILTGWAKTISLTEDVVHPDRIEQAPLIDRITIEEARLIIAALEKAENS